MRNKYYWLKEGIDRSYDIRVHNLKDVNRILKKYRIKSFKKTNSIIEFENISLSYGNRLILDNISFKINEGQIFGMLGPNGVGKSTIFNLITGLVNPKEGNIEIAGENVNQFPRVVANAPFDKKVPLQIIRKGKKIRSTVKSIFSIDNVITKYLNVFN